MYRRTPIFFRIADSFFRHQILFWSALLIVSGLTMGALYARSKTFHAAATAQIQADNVHNMLIGQDNFSWSTPAQQNSDRFMELIKQDQPGGFLDIALKNAQLVTPINVNPQADDPRYAMLEKNLYASPDSTNQFSIGLTWDNPAETSAIVQALLKQYIAEVGADRALTSTESVHFLDSEIASVKAKLNNEESALANFKKGYGGQLSDAESGYNNQLASLTAELDEKQITMGENGRKKAVLEQELAQMKPMSILEQNVSDQSPLEREVADLLARRDAVLATGKTPLHPDVVSLDTRIEQLKAQQHNDANAPENQHNTQTKLQENPQFQALKEQIADATIAQEADEQEMQNLQQQVTKYKILVNQIPAAQRQLADKLRDYQLLQARYTAFMQKRSDLEMAANLDSLTASKSIIPIGVTYALPTTGRTKLIAMLFGSLFLGFLVGVVLVVLSEWADHSLRHEADAERLLGVPVLATLPEASDLRVAANRRALSGAPPALPRPVPEG